MLPIGTSKAPSIGEMFKDTPAFGDPLESPLKPYFDQHIKTALKGTVPSTETYDLLWNAFCAGATATREYDVHQRRTN